MVGRVAAASLVAPLVTVAVLTVSCAAQGRSSVVMPADGCRPRVHPNDAILTGGYTASDSRLHFRIAYDHDVGPFQKKAFHQAMAMWNEHSRVTEVVFEETTTADVDFRLQRGASILLEDPAKVEQDKCSAYFSGGSYIWYSPANMDWVKTDADIPAAARIYAHELGHVLNVYDQEGRDSVMHGGDPQTSCQQLASVVLRDITVDDAERARRCAHGLRDKWAQEQQQEQRQQPQQQEQTGESPRNAPSLVGVGPARPQP